MRKYRSTVTCILLAVFVCIGLQRSGTAALNAEQRRELAAIWRDARGISALLRRKKTDEAAKVIEDVDTRVKALADAAMLPEDDRAIAGLLKYLDRQRQQMARLLGTGDGANKNGISFTDDIAPIVTANCLGCHGENPRAGLRLTTFADWRRGGKSGLLLTPRIPARSLLIARLTALPNQRMPRNAPALATEEIQKIALWISQGAEFDGNDEATPLAQLKRKTGAEKEKEEPVVIAMATGDETISFKRDIAPFMITRCLGCHGTRNPRSGFSLATFESLMRGGESGPVVIGGDLDSSRMWDLAGKQDPIKMPAGDGRITRKNHSDLRKWILEGAKYDGGDPKQPIRDLVPTDAEKKLEELANLSPQEFEALRIERTEALWKRVLPRDQAETVSTNEFVVFGNVPPGRLQEVSDWATEHVEKLRQTFQASGKPLWKGKLTVFVVNERFGYEEFNQAINRRRTPPELIGHAVVVPSYEDAYIVLQDVGDEPDEKSPGMRANLVDQLTVAFLQRGEGELPEWLARGMGLTMAHAVSTENPYMNRLPELAAGALVDIRKPEDVFDPNTFSPAQVGPIGYSLVNFLIKAEGRGKFNQLANRLKNGDPLDAALKDVYRSNLRATASAFLANFKR